MGNASKYANVRAFERFLRIYDSISCILNGNASRFLVSLKNECLTSVYVSRCTTDDGNE